MTLAERLRADFAGLELTAGTHPMALIRSSLPDVFRAVDLPLVKDGERVTIAGSHAMVLPGPGHSARSSSRRKTITLPDRLISST